MILADNYLLISTEQNNNQILKVYNLNLEQIKSFDLINFCQIQMPFELKRITKE